MRLHEEILGYQVYFVDLSEWKLRFSDRTPFICVSQADLAALAPRELEQILLEVVRTRELAERNPVVLIDGPGQDLQAAFKAQFSPIMVLDAAAQAAVRASRRPRSELLDRLSAQVDLGSLVPYETSRPVTGSRFFGREAEVHRIVASADGNFAIMGIRRIGKTSLMREVERQLKAQAQERGDNNAVQRILFMDCSALRSPTDFVQKVVRQLRPQELVRLSNKQFPIYFPDFLHRMAQRYGGPIFFFLDEFDRVLTWVREDDTLLNALRASSIQDDSRYVIGGFREVMRAFSDLESPLVNFARPVRLKEFTYEQTLNMVTGPLEKLGVEFEKRGDVVARIVQWAAGDRYIVPQSFAWCAELVQGYRRHLVDRRVVDRAACRLFLANEARSPAPLREAIHTIEEDADSVLDVLHLLEHDQLARSRAHQMPTRTGADRLQLSGAVLLSEGSYILKNYAYRRALTRHFTTDRVGHILRMAGRWQETIAYQARR